MNNVWDMDAIVREVLRRLGALPDPAAPAPPAAPGDLVLAEPVVTLATLRDRLAGIQRVVVSPRAVVTPAVRDELRKLGIRWERGLASSARATTERQTLLVTDCPKFEPQRWLAKVPGAVLRDVARTVPGVATELAAWVQDPRVAVWWTPHPAAAVCAANRHPHLRAFMVLDAESVADAVRDANINVLVLDLRRKQAGEWPGWIEQFRGLPRPPVAGTTS